MPWHTELAISKPQVMAHWYVKMTEPLTHLGDASDWYKGTIADSIPTDTPDTNLPIQSKGIAAEAVCNALPILKIIAAERMMERLRPYESDNNGAINAPQKVPNERMAVINARSCTVKPSRGLVANDSMTGVISIMSFMSPVS